MDFPHIEDTSFPHLDNVDVYKYKNNFDYARWQGKATYKMLNVRWNSTYSDIPWFETDEKRDEWFDIQEGLSGVLESVFNNTPETSLKIPVPYNVAYDYNYIVVDMPVQTSLDNPINYENSNDRVSRWYFFIEDMTQTAPNTTELELSIDYWTSFVNKIDIPYLMLERGHAPMTKISVENYLRNPIYNNEYLLADDFNYGNETIIQTSTYKPVGNGTKYVLFCAPYKQSDFANFGGSAYSGSSTLPTFSDLSSRWGYQLQVNDYEWKYGDSDYSNADLPISNEVTNGILNGCNCYAIEGSQAQAFFNECAKYCVNFIHGIKALFILDENLFVKGNGFTFRNKTIYPVMQKHSSEIFSFNRNQFGFDSKYANITKLYTSPYSLLEVTDDEGNIFTAKIENCGSIKIHSEISIVYPFLNYNVFFSGINGDGEMQYTWKNINGTSNTEIMWASDFSKFMMNWKIPTYSIFVSAKDEYAANNYYGNRAKRAGAIKDYENAVRYANTTYENTDDLTDTNVANTQTQNTANTDITDRNNLMRTNITINDNTMRTTITDNDNTMRTTISDNDRDTLDDNRVTTNAALGDSATANKTKMDGDVVEDAQYAATCFGINSGVATAITNTNAVAGIDVAGTSGIIGAFTGNITGGISGVIGATIRGSAAQTTNSIAIGGSLTNTVAAASYATQKNQIAKDNIDDLTLIQQNANKDITDRNRQNILDNKNAVNSNASANTTAKNTNATDNTTETNDNATDNTTTQNAASLAISQALATVTDNNADYMRDATVAAEKANLIQKQLEVANTYQNAKLQAPHQQGEYQGDFMPDVYKRRGIRFNVRTQSKAAIAQAGDAMLRFGYALHRTWDMSLGFHYGKHFTFWRAEDIWINDGEGVANVAVNTIASLFMKGVTVWRDPDEIGRVSIYDNI